HGSFPDVLHGRLWRAEADRRVTGDDCGDRGPAASERNMNEVETKGEPELLARKMRLRASPRRTEAEFSGIGFDEGDKLRDGLRRDRRIDREYGGRGDGERDRIEVLDRIVRHAGEQCRVDYVRAERKQDRVAVGRRPRHLAGSDITRRASDVLDIDLLAKLL